MSICPGCEPNKEVRATSHEMLKTLSNDIEMNSPPDLTDSAGHWLLGMKCHFLEVNARYFSDYVGFALWYYRKRRFPPYQVVWPNSDGLYPGTKMPQSPSKNGSLC
jgi:hypothetical protein